MNKAKILIVDDKENNLVALEMTCRYVDAEFIRATSGNDALKQVLSHDFALAIIDVQMPEMDGYELAQLIRGREQTAHLPIIFISAIYTDEFHIFKGYDAGAVDFISKPFEPRMLRNKIRVFLELFEQRRQLRQSTQLYEGTFDAISDVVLIQDSSMHVRQVNKAGCDLLNLPEEKIVGRCCYEVFRGSTSPCEGCSLTQRGARETICSWEMEHPNLGSHFQLIASPLQLSDDEILTVYVARDITEQKMIKEQLLQAEKLEAIGTLAGGIAHDFNNILSAVLGFVEVSLMAERLSPDLKENLRNIKRAGLRAKELVAQILTFSRKASTSRSPIIITPLLKEAIKLLRATIPKTVEIKTDIADVEDKIMADPIEIHQIVMNLCTNSYQSIEDERGVIEVSLQSVKIDTATARRKTDLEPGEYQQLRVRDTGKGMDKNMQSRIFDPFFTTKEKGQGTGMGLSVVHGITRNCGGTLIVASEPGRGSVFDIFFPVVAREFTESSDVAVAMKEGSGCVLFVDDEAELLDLGSRYLEFLGYTVVSALSGDEALEIFRKSPDKFVAVITDQTMPGLPGNVLAEELMKIRPDLPIVLSTGYSSVVTEKKVLESGIKAFLQKPVAIQVLADTMHKVIKGD